MLYTEVLYTETAVAHDDGRRKAERAVDDGIVDVSRPHYGGRTLLQRLVSLAGAIGIAVLLPFMLLLVGLPIALAVRGLAESISWLLARIL